MTAVDTDSRAAVGRASDTGTRQEKLKLLSRKRRNNVDCEVQRVWMRDGGLGSQRTGSHVHRTVRPTKPQSSVCGDKSVGTRAGKAWKEKGGRSSAHVRAPGSASPQPAGAP